MKVFDFLSNTLTNFLFLDTYSELSIFTRRVKPSNCGSKVFKIALSMTLTLGLAIVRGRSSPDFLGILILRLLGKENAPLNNFALAVSNQTSEIPDKVSSPVPLVNIPGLLLS
jgi:hypothetical protein